MKSRWLEITALSGALVGFHILFQRLKHQRQRTLDRTSSVHAHVPDRVFHTEASPALPLDLLLEIFARSDPATVARCGATCKLLRHHVTDPAFLRRLRAAASDHHRFLLALLYHHGRLPSLFAAPKSSGSLQNTVIARLSNSLAGLDDPVASGCGLLVLRRWTYYSTCTLSVCDPVAGRSHVLPPRDICEHLLLVMPEDDDEEGNGVLGDMPMPFKVFIADSGLRTQTYSSKAGAWGPVTDTMGCLRVPGHYKHVQPSPVVLGGVAHWLYRQGSDSNLYSVLALGIVTAGQATWIEVPRECHRRRRDTDPKVHKELLLVSSADGELALLVWERPLAVSMWTVLSSSSSWARRVLIDCTAILRSVRPRRHPIACQRIEFQWFAQGSGAVVFYMNSVGVVLLNLRTLEVRHLQRWDLESFDSVSPLCVYELDMVSLLHSR